MIRDLQNLRDELERAVQNGDREKTFVLATKYLQLYHQCWPS